MKEQKTATEVSVGVTSTGDLDALIARVSAAQLEVKEKQ